MKLPLNKFAFGLVSISSTLPFTAAFTTFTTFTTWHHPLTLNPSFRSQSRSQSSSSCLNESNNNTNKSDLPSIDVSDLGLTLTDLETKLPLENFSFQSSGYQSTSRIPSVHDDGCHWTETPEGYMDVTLRIPGLRGQPPACFSVLFSTTTVSVTAFGRVVWSCIQRGVSEVEECSFLVEEGEDGVPVIQLSVKKREGEERWGGFILQIGEDSIL